MISFGKLMVPLVAIAMAGCATIDDLSASQRARLERVN